MPTIVRLPNSARRPRRRGLHESHMDPTSSPPIAPPWARRSSTSSTGARMPTSAYVGSAAMSAVGIAIATTESCERALPAMPVAELAEQEAADRPHEVANGEHAEGVQEAGERIGGREEPRSDHRREECEHDEVVPARARCRSSPRRSPGAGRARPTRAMRRSRARARAAASAPDRRRRRRARGRHRTRPYQARDEPATPPREQAAPPRRAPGGCVPSASVVSVRYTRRMIRVVPAFFSVSRRACRTS